MIQHYFYTNATNDAGIRTKIFKRAKQNLPNTLLFVNDYGILLNKYDRLNQYVEQIRGLLDEGAPIEGIGIQSHFTDNEAADPIKIKEALDLLWTTFQLPIWMTEFDWSDGSEIADGNHTRHAEQLDNFYRMSFSHPGVEGILMWGFWDQINNRYIQYNKKTTNKKLTVYTKFLHL